MSATLSEDVRALKRMVLHNAVSVMENISEPPTHLYLKTEKKKKICVRCSFIYMLIIMIIEIAFLLLP